MATPAAVGPSEPRNLGAMPGVWFSETAKANDFDLIDEASCALLDKALLDGADTVALPARNTVATLNGPNGFYECAADDAPQASKRRLKKRVEEQPPGDPSLTTQANEIFAIAMNDDPEALEPLLRAFPAGADTRSPHVENITPLMAACAKGCLAVLPLLIAASSDLALRDDGGRSALWMAAVYGNPECVRQLLAAAAATPQGAGRLVNIANRGGTTPLIGAAAEGHLEIVRMLLAVPEIEINAAANDGSTALIVAACRGNLSVVDVLVGLPGIELEARDAEGQTAIDAALKNGHVPIAERLRDAGAQAPRGLTYLKMHDNSPAIPIPMSDEHSSLLKNPMDSLAESMAAREDDETTQATRGAEPALSAGDGRPVCAVCTLTKAQDGTALKVCGRCKASHYCCRDHQTKHWPKHKLVCKLN